MGKKRVENQEGGNRGALALRKWLNYAAESASTSCRIAKEAYPAWRQRRYHHGSFDQRICRSGKRMEYKSWMCLICGWIYDEEAGLPDEGIAPGTRWEDVPVNWTCPECGARKEDFEMVQI
jgi:rubredoxin